MTPGPFGFHQVLVYNLSVPRVLAYLANVSLALVVEITAIRGAVNLRHRAPCRKGVYPARGSINALMPRWVVQSRLLPRYIAVDTASNAPPQGCEDPSGCIKEVSHAALYLRPLRCALIGAPQGPPDYIAVDNAVDCHATRVGPLRLHQSLADTLCVTREKDR